MNTTNTQDLVLKALDRAFVMGQNYWADADSESWKAHKRSDVTREKFRAMRDEVCAALQSPAPQPSDRPCKVGGPCVPTATSTCACRELPPSSAPAAQPQGDARNVVQPELQDPPWDEAGDFHHSAKVLQRYAAREWALAYGQECFAAGMQAAQPQGFDAGDMATAAADGFRDGVASTQASEPSAYTYASKQATKCAGCGEHKHTPLRIDAMGGYVCLTCIDKKLGGLLNEFGYASGPVSDGWQLSVADGHAGYGVYAHMEEYPEEGSVLVLELAAPARAVEPLTDEQIDAIARPDFAYSLTQVFRIYARAIERAHGIGIPATTPTKTQGGEA